MKSDASQRLAEIERKQKAIRDKLDRLDQAFLFERTIDIDTYDRHRDKLREELTLAQMDRIIVLSQGRIVEQGTFQELLQQNGAFAAMARRQGITP